MERGSKKRSFVSAPVLCQRSFGQWLAVDCRVAPRLYCTMRVGVPRMADHLGGTARERAFFLTFLCGRMNLLPVKRRILVLVRWRGGRRGGVGMVASLGVGVVCRTRSVFV